MTDSKSPKSGISRRSFLKASAAVAAGSALAGGSTSALAFASAQSSQQAEGDQVFCASCRGNCMNGCALDVHVREGKVVRTSMHEYPSPEYNRVCLKGLSHVEAIYGPTRLKYPMRRVEGTPRGGGQWEKISWEEAINEICAKWTAYREEYGPSSILEVPLSGAYDCANAGQNGCMTRLSYLLAMSRWAPCFDRNLIMGYGQTFGTGSTYNTNAHADMVNSKTIINWGSNLPESQIQTWHFVAEARDKGAKLITINPSFDIAAAKSDYWVTIRPGTDAFLANAMSNYLIQQGLADEEFLKTSTVAPFALKNDGKYLRLSDFDNTIEVNGEDDDFFVFDEQEMLRPLSEVGSPQLFGAATYQGIEVETVYSQLVRRLSDYTLDRAEAICDIPQKTIVEITELYAKNGPGWIYQGFGMDRWHNGHSAVLSIATLSMIAGQLGKPGASCGYAMAIGMEWYNFLAPYMTAEVPDGAQVNVPALQFFDIMEKKMFKGEPLNIKSAFVYTGNWLNCTADRKRMMEALDDIEFIVTIDVRATETTQYSDIVLPASHWFEDEGLYGRVAPHTFLQINEKCIDPLYESKPDFEIAQLLAQGMGKANCFPEGMTLHDYVVQCFTPAENQVMAYDGPITYERLAEEKVLPYADPYYIHGAGGIFPTETGRAQMYLETLEPFADFDYELMGIEPDVREARWPHFEKPIEAWPQTVDAFERNALADKYPLVYYQEHQRYRTHSEWSHTPLLRELDAEPLCNISPEDAEARGIANNDIVRVFNDHGECVLRARINSAQRPGQVNIPKGWGADQFIRGSWQDLTWSDPNPVEHNSSVFDTLVEVELFTEGV